MIGILGFIASFLGLVAAIYFYQISKKERVVTFVNEPTQITILESSKIEQAPIEIYDKDKNRVNSNLFVSTIYFWNRGKESIKEDNILEELKITYPDSRIIDFSILKSNRQISKIKLDKIKPNELSLTFSILEQNDGFSAQVIYEADKTVTPKLNGIVEGVRKFSDFPYNNYQLLGKSIINLLIGIGLLLLTFLANGIGGSRYIAPQETKEYRTNEEYRKAVDRLDEVRSDMYQSDKPAKNEDKGSKKFPWKIVLYIGLTILLSGILIGTWVYTKNDIIKNPSYYVPTEIKK